MDLIPNQGARIRVQTLSELGEVYAVRAQLEGFAASLESIQSDLEAVVTSLSLPEEQRAIDATINAQITRFNEDFHAVIRDAAGNGLLDRMINDLQRHFPKDYVWRTIGSVSQIRAINVAEHRRILKALKRHDASAAQSAMSGHVQHAGAILLRHLHERGAAS